MSTLKSDGIQPTLNTNNLIIRSGADVERLRIQPNGQILVASTTGTTFAGEVNFSNTIRIPGGVQVGGGIGPTRYTALDVVTSNTGLGLPDAANYNTTRSRSNMMVKPSGSVTNGDITLFMGSSAGGSWLQVQAETGNAVKNLLLNPAGGSVIVGSFAGDTNVMVKPSNTTPGAVGYVQPFYFGYSGQTSRGIPAGTWFVYGQWVENTNSSSDNDPTNFMAKVWTVPTGKYLHIASDDQLWGTTDAGNGGKINLHWKMSDNATESISGAVSSWGAGWNTFVIPPTSNPSATTVGSDTVTAMSGYVFGYAQYDTYGVRGNGNNTPLGPGYGYIQRLA